MATQDISSLPAPSKLEKLKTNVKPYLKKALIVTGTAVGFLAVGYLVSKAVASEDETEDFEYITIEESEPATDETPAND